MATVRGGNKGVLIVVDVQVGVVGEAREAPRVVGNVARAVERARAGSVSVVWMQDADDELALGSPAWQWMPEMVPADGEPLIHKHFNSSLELTALEAELARLGANHIVLAGAATHWCILATATATAFAALERGYDLALIEDSHGTAKAERVDFAAAGGVR